ncbi:MAG TPA: TetR/AcrR family transcriptional regulator [Stellaceae bacterium]|nr:TetR/AcrR family transcriptional regulator [Stellaceae bacterium]
MKAKTARRNGRTSPARRMQDPEGVKRNIIEIATEEFAANGYNGARVDEIAARTNSSKRMLYYYFGDKEGLFRAVLEEGYRRMRQVEAARRYDHLKPEAALRALVEFTFDHQNANVDFIRLVVVENIHNGVHLARSENIQRLNAPAITTLREIYRRGVAAKTFRPGLDIVDLHMSISALSFFNVANRATFSRIFGREMGTPAASARRREIVVDLILRYVSGNPD